MSTILVIDDNPAVATALEVLFSLHDLRTISAESPQARLAVRSLQTKDILGSFGIPGVTEWRGAEMGRSWVTKTVLSGDWSTRLRR